MRKDVILLIGSQERPIFPQRWAMLRLQPKRRDQRPMTRIVHDVATDEGVLRSHQDLDLPRSVAELHLHRSLVEGKRVVDLTSENLPHIRDLYKVAVLLAERHAFLALPEQERRPASRVQRLTASLKSLLPP